MQIEKKKASCRISGPFVCDSLSIATTHGTDGTRSVHHSHVSAKGECARHMRNPDCALCVVLDLMPVAAQTLFQSDYPPETGLSRTAPCPYRPNRVILTVSKKVVIDLTMTASHVSWPVVVSPLDIAGALPDGVLCAVIQYSILYRALKRRNSHYPCHCRPPSRIRLFGANANANAAQPNTAALTIQYSLCTYGHNLLPPHPHIPLSPYWSHPTGCCCGCHHQPPTSHIHTVQGVDAGIRVLFLVTFPKSCEIRATEAETAPPEPCLHRIVFLLYYK